MQRNKAQFRALQKAGLGLQMLEKLSTVNYLSHKKVQNTELVDQKNSRPEVFPKHRHI